MGGCPPTRRPPSQSPSLREMSGAPSSNKTGSHRVAEWKHRKKINDGITLLANEVPTVVAGEHKAEVLVKATGESAGLHAAEWRAGLRRVERGAPAQCARPCVRSTPPPSIRCAAAQNTSSR